MGNEVFRDCCACLGGLNKCEFHSVDSVGWWLVVGAVCRILRPVVSGLDFEEVTSADVAILGAFPKVVDELAG